MIPVENSAVLSDDECHRYVLRRGLGSMPLWPRPVVFVMLNPSTADATKDDPTIRRCVSFAKRLDATELVVVNLCSYRATKPTDLIDAMAAGVDVCPGENRRHIQAEIAKADWVVFAWGAHWAKLGWNVHLAQAEHIALDTCATLGITPLCLGTTKDGYPRHPLYVHGDAPFLTYPWQGEVAKTAEDR